MAISFKCACGKALTVPDSMAGKQGVCPGCKKPLAVPAAGGGAKPASGPEPETRVAKGPPPPLVKPGAKPAAAAPVPATARPGAKPAAAPAAAKPPAAAAPADPAADPPADPAAPEKKCQNCGKTWPADTVVCVACGFNMRSGMKLRSKLGDAGAE